MEKSNISFENTSTGFSATFTHSPRDAFPLEKEKFYLPTMVGYFIYLALGLYCFDELLATIGCVALVTFLFGRDFIQTKFYSKACK